MQRRHAWHQSAAISIVLLALSHASAAQESPLAVGRKHGNTCTQSVSLSAPPAAPAQPPGGFQFPAPAGAPADATRLERVADGVYAVINVSNAAFPDIPVYGGNTTIILTEAGAVLVDARTELMHEDLVAKVRSLTEAPIQYVVLTHNHADHSDGAARLQALGATVVTSATEAQRMAAAGARTLPQIGYEGRTQLRLGDTRIELIEFCGHTSADTVVYLPEARVVIGGDLVATPDSIPQIANYADGGSWTDMARALDALATLDFDVLVAGHGPVLSREQFLAHRDKIKGITDRVRELVTAGSTDARITQVLAEEFNWGGPGPAAANVPGMQAEFKP